MITQHHEVFAQYWQWSDDWVQHSLQTGMMRSAMSWQCAVGIRETKERSIRNWPIQTACADMLRIACIVAARHRIRILAPVHDAVLIEAPIERIEADVKLMQEIMRRASRIVLNNTASGDRELRTDANIIRYPDRNTDKRGTDMWNEVMDKLAVYLKRREQEVA
jgi:DNA polymerase-1